VRLQSSRCVSYADECFQWLIENPHSFGCWMKSKRGRIRRVKHWHIAFFVILSTSIALAEDFKTVTGKEFKDATVTRVEGDGIVLRTKTGISKVYFIELPKDVQEKFRPAPATPVPAPREPVNVESKQGEHPQAHGGGTVVVVGKYSGHRQTNEGAGRVVVVGQSAGTLKIVIAGIILLVGVVLAIIRSRF
jgi:hypothetical protein